MKQKRDYYHVLHVHPDADPAVIKASYRTLMQKLRNHPDLGGSDANAALINEAYAVLSDPQARARYDALFQRKSASHKNLRVDDSAPNDPNREKAICLFCKQANFIHKLHPTASELNCSRCLSPLRFIDFDPEWVGYRAARSVKQNIELTFAVGGDFNQRLPGWVDDVSPTGMRFSSAQALRMGNIIKIETRELSAVASVMRCEAGGQRNQHLIAVKFLSLKVHNARGTFISQKV